MRTRNALVLALVLAVSSLACRDDGPTGLAGSPRDGRVFIDNFIAADFEAFAGSKFDAVQLDNVTKFRGTNSLRVTIPAPGDPSGGFAGGAFVASQPRDLTGFTALTFYARASIPATINTAGIANDNTGNSPYISERSAIAITTTWQKYTIPIPRASRLTAEAGLFYFAEGAEGGVGYDLWFDDIQFENVLTVGNPRPTFTGSTVTTEVGATQQLTGFGVTFAVNGADQFQTTAAGYFDFTSSTPATATVNSTGQVSVLAAGSTNITATLGGLPVAGTLALTAVSPPSIAAAAPTRDAADVISLFSNSYTNNTVNTWSAVWDNADVTDATIAGNAVKRYSNLVFAGIEFTSAPVNATTMTGFHVDVYVNDATNLSLKLVDFGANGVYDGPGSDDTEGTVVLNAGTVPALVAGQWNSFDLPLSAFGGMTGRSAVAQLIMVGSSSITYLDNLYFYRVNVPTEPSTAAPTPTAPGANVISLFSNAYSNATVDTWSAVWDMADVADVQIAGNDVKKYTNFTFAGIEFTSATIDASAMTTFNFDFWTPDATDAPVNFQVKLVDFGANGTYDGPGAGDDVEHQLTFTAATSPALATGQWVHFEIPLTAFTGLTTRAHLAQIVINSGPDTVFLDNIYFSNAAPRIAGRVDLQNAGLPRR